MKITLNELRMSIDDIGSDIRIKSQELSENVTKRIHKDMNGNSEIMSLEYDFKKSLSELEDLTNELIKRKSLLQTANLTTKVNEEDTIASALIKLEQKRSMMKNLKTFLTYKESKSRKIDSSYSNSYYIEEIKLNYEKEELEKMRNELREELNLLESQLTMSNSKTLVDID